jgi:hypothetical protein
MKISEAEEQKRGEALVRAFNLKQVKDERGNYYDPPRYLMFGETKTALGLFRTTQRVIESGDL